LNLADVLEPHILSNLLDVSDHIYYLAGSEDGERLMITFGLVFICVYYGPRGPPDIPHSQNDIYLHD
jgi:hypothetical protein